MPVVSRSGSNDYVDWLSDKTELAPGTELYRLTRLVVNRDTLSRDVYWPTARMHVRPLEPRHMALLCRSRVDGANVAQGPLYFARDRGARLNTEVFEGAAEPLTSDLVRGRPLELTTSLSIIPDSITARPCLHIQFVTIVTVSERGYVISYRMTNRGTRAVQLSIPGLPFEALRQLDMVPQRILAPGSELRVDIPSSTLPLPSETIVSIGDGSGGRVRASATADTYVPGTGAGR